jgi:hypothetical protein
MCVDFMLLSYDSNLYLGILELLLRASRHLPLPQALLRCAPHKDLK